MHNERLEHEIALLDGKPTVLIIPQFGSVSISHSGILSWAQNGHQVQFHLATPSIGIIFFVEDVSKVEPPVHDFRNIIRLKGPHEYRENFQKENH